MSDTEELPPRRSYRDQASLDFWDRLQAAREIIDAQPFAVMSSKTKPPTERGWGIVHWKTAESLAALMPNTYKITRRGGRIRNIKLHPEEEPMTAAAERPAGRGLDQLEPGARSDSLRLRTEVHRTKKQAPPWHDEWSISMDGPSLLQVSAELMAMGELPPGLNEIRRLTEDVIAHGLGIDDGWSAAQGPPLYQNQETSA